MRKLSFAEEREQPSGTKVKDVHKRFIKKGPQEPYHYTNAMHEPEAGGGKPGESSRKPQKQNTLDYGKGEATPKNAVKDRKNGEQAKGKKIMLAAEEEVREEDYGKYSSSSKGPEEKTRSAPKKEGNKQASEQKTSPMSKIGDVKKRHDDGVGAAAKKDSTSDAAAKKDRKGVEAKKANKETTEKKDAKSKKAEKEQPKDAKSKKAEKEKQKTKEPQEKAASKTKATPPKRDAAKTPKDKKDNNDKEDAKLKKRQRVDEKAEKEKEGVASESAAAALLRADTEDIAAKEAAAEKKERERKAYKARKGRFYRSLDSPGLRHSKHTQKWSRQTSPASMMPTSFHCPGPNTPMELKKAVAEKRESHLAAGIMITLEGGFGRSSKYIPIPKNNIYQLHAPTYSDSRIPV